MYYYAPPKSSTWGHRLRNMPAIRAKERLAMFLDRAAADHRFGWCRPGSDVPVVTASLTVLGDDPAREQHFEELIGKPAYYKSFDKLDPAQFDRCLAEIVALEKSTPSMARTVLLNQTIEIMRWRIGDQSVPMRSRLTMFYGQARALSTYLEFCTVEDFHWVAGVFAEVGLCKLNPKHLKLDRSRAAAPPASADAAR